MKTNAWVACAALAGAFFVLSGCDTPTERLQNRFRGTRFKVTACSETIKCEDTKPQNVPCNMVGWILEFKADITADGTANAGEFGNATASTNFGWKVHIKDLGNGTHESHIDITGFPVGNGDWEVDHFRPWPKDPTKEELEIISSWRDSSGCEHTVTIVADLQK